MPHPRTNLTLALAGTVVFATFITAAAAAEFADDTEVAVIGAQRVALSQLPAQLRADLDHSEQQYAEQLRQLALDHRRELHALVEGNTASFLDQEILMREAQARGASVEQLEQEIQNPTVSDVQVHAFYDEHRRHIAQPLEEVAPAITQYLRAAAAEDARETLRTKYAARVTVEPLRQQVAAEGPGRGAQHPVVTIVEFADFQCPYCRQMAPLLEMVLDRYPTQVRLVYRQLPLTDLHPNAMTAAQASVCAGAQGKFWEMHDALFADAGALTAPGAQQAAQRLQLKTQDFTACLGSQQVAATIRADARAAAECGVVGTPGLFINGRFVGGAISYEQLVALVKDELTRSGVTLAQATPAG